jgi:hypothetical protein
MQRQDLADLAELHIPRRSGQDLLDADAPAGS